MEHFGKEVMSSEYFVKYFLPFGLTLFTLNVWLLERQDPPEVKLRKRMNQAWMLHPAAKKFRDKHLQDMGYDLPDEDKDEK